MTTEKDLNRLADTSYWVDKGKENIPFNPKKGTILTPKTIKGLTQPYKVLKVIWICRFRNGGVLLKK
ncbi:hypothetical protein HCJ66_10940 [Listeria sp. FSL L7-1582]|uniref:hypothetical protein n=1 Tax=Listeria portnoyi TaxID=2713504 RepID=UPI00164D8420|nr:hypothetical protein [Listeria portnoyi]MBC6310055.1 hypothetical protein [Listeria portnoyi]